MPDVSKLRLDNVSYDIKDDNARKYLVMVNEEPVSATKVVIETGEEEGVELALQEDIDSVNTRVTSEATARTNAINAEASARQIADNTLQTNIDTEATARESGYTNLSNQIAALQGSVGSPLVAATKSAMTNTNKIYVYTGSESGMTNGNWYYHNGSAWVSGGVYNASAVNTDKTLSVSDMPADAKITGDLKNALNAVSRGWNAWDEDWGTGYEFNPNTGELRTQTANRIYAKNKCEIESGQYYYIYCGTNGFIDFFFWDASNNFISSGIIWSKKNGEIIKTPDNAKFFAIETYLYGTKYLNNICINKYTPNGELQNGMYLPYVARTVDNTPIVESLNGIKKSKLESYNYTNTPIESAYNVEWELGDINVDSGKDVRSTSLLRSNYIPLYGQGTRLSISSEDGYSVGIRIYEQPYPEMYVGAVGQRAYPYTQLTVSGRYYRFIIKNDNSQTADLSWATHVKIIVEPTYDITQLRSEEIIRPDFERFDLPSAVTGWQDFVLINDKILFFSSSSDGFGDADGNIYIVNKSDFSYVKTIHHNFGHVNAVDYDSENDILLTGSATDYVNDPEIYFIYNASSLLSMQNDGSALFSNFETTTISLLDLQNEYGVLSYVSACFGQKQADNNGRDIVINATVQQKWFIIRPTVTAVGGSVRYSTAYETIVFKSYTHTTIPEIKLDTPVCQGIALHKGRLYSTTSHHSCNVAEWIFNMSGQLTKNNYYVDCGNNGNEGLEFIDDQLYAGNSTLKCLIKMII